MANRRERRAAKSKVRKSTIALNQVCAVCDIEVDAKVDRIVMIMANPRGREIVERLWPDVEWATDEHMASHPADWLFTHIRVTKLPPHLEASVPLAFASIDSVGMAVAMALQRFAEPRRVAHYTGQGRDVQVNFYDGRGMAGEKDVALSLFAEYVPAGTLIGAPPGVN